MHKLMTLLMALFLSVVAMPAAASIAEIAERTNWSLANSVNPFYIDGRKGISEAEAMRLPVGTPIAFIDGTSRPIQAGETVWGLNEQLTSLPAPPPDKTASGTENTIDTAEASRLRTEQVRKAAEAKAISSAAEAAEQAATVATASDEAFAATQATQVSAEAAENAATRAVQAESRFVTDWVKTTLLIIGLIVATYYLVVMVLFSLFPKAMNAYLGGPMLSATRDELPLVGTLLLILLTWPLLLVWYGIPRRRYYETHYGYLVAADRFKTQAGKDAWLTEDGSNRALLSETPTEEEEPAVNDVVVETYEVEQPEDQDLEMHDEHVMPTPANEHGELRSSYPAEHPFSINRTVGAS